MRVLHENVFSCSQPCDFYGPKTEHDRVEQGWISDTGIDGPTFVPKSGYFLLIWVKVCPQKLAFP